MGTKGKGEDQPTGPRVETRTNEQLVAGLVDSIVTQLVASDPSPKFRRHVRLASDREYFLHLDPAAVPLLGADASLLQPLGDQGIYKLSLINRIGLLRLGTLQLDAVSRKLSPSGFRQLVTEVAEYMATLPFSFSGAGAGYQRSPADATATKYHTFVHVRHLLETHALQNAVTHIVSNPHISFVQERIESRVERARRVDATTVRRLAASPRHFEPVQPGATVAGSALGSRLEATSLAGHFPGRVSAAKLTMLVDNPENQFVVHALEWMLREVSSLAASLGCPADIASECAAVVRQLERLLAHDLFRRVSRPDRLHLASQVLQRRAGYREMLKFYSQLLLPPAPVWAQDLQQILELKDAATVYEYWVFITICKLMEDILGTDPIAAQSGSIGRGKQSERGWGPGGQDLGIKAAREPTDAHMHTRSRRGLETILLGGIRVDFTDDIRVEYNPHVRGYSGSFYPDVVVTTPVGMWVFDAKFRLTADTSDALTEDIHKMHTYRDALPACRASYVVYPGAGDTDWYPVRRGTEGESAVDGFDGVGAIPLAPGAESSALGDKLRRIVGSVGKALHD